MDLCDLFKKGEFVSQKFKDSIKRTFIATGSAPREDGTFVEYSANSMKGSLPIIPTGTVMKEEFSHDANYIDLVNLIDGDDDENESEDECE